MFSKSCEYAMRAAIYIAIKSIDGQRLGIKEIAKEIDSPRHFTAKVMQTLTAAGIINSIKGPNGGFYLEKSAAPIPLNAIVKAVDGTHVLHSCVLGLKACSNQLPCPLHHQVVEYKSRIRKLMEEKTIQELASDINSGKFYLKNLIE